jgi:hypothetical protein
MKGIYSKERPCPDKSETISGSRDQLTISLGLERDASKIFLGRSSIKELILKEIDAMKLLV